MFIRIKTRRNSKGEEMEYGYLVTNSWRKRSKMPKQKVGRYLGRIYRFDSNENEYVMNGHGFRDALIDMVRFELINVGFIYVNGRYWNGECFVDLSKLSVYNDKGKECVVQLNDGFLCSWSLRKLLKVEVREREDADYFAKILRLSGLNVTPDTFVGLFNIATGNRNS